MPARSHNVVFEQLDRRLDGNTVFRDRGLEQTDSLVLGLIYALSDSTFRRNRSEEATTD